MLRAVIGATAVALTLALGVAALGAGERERWVDDTAGQGVEFTRDITHTLVPSFFDQRAAGFTCGDGSTFNDPLVVIVAGDGSGRDLDLKIASDGSFSYDGPATMTNGTGTMRFQGKFSGASASGTVQWTANRPTNDGGSCTASAGPAQWTAHCSEQCGGTSGGAITVSTNGKPVVGQWALIDVTVKSDGSGRIAAFAHHDGARACGSFTDEDAVAARKGKFGVVERLGEAQVPGPGTFVFHGKYIPDQFGHADRICAYLTQAPAGETVLARGEGTPRIGFALPVSGVWGGPIRQGLYDFNTPHSEQPKGTARGFQILGTWACDPPWSTSHLYGRRWWIGANDFGKALRLMPIRPRADGSFSFSGAAHPDFTDNYEPPRPKKWPSRSMHVTLSGRFFAGHRPLDGTGVVRGARGKLLVVNGSHRCSRKLKITGEAPTSELSSTLDDRYNGTLTQ